MSAIKEHMMTKVRMEGNVNGHCFTIEGTGAGQPYEGQHTRNLKVTKGAPLPFAYDIMTNAFQYGNRVFTKYPSEIPDYFKQCFPKGMKWERSMIFEDGGVCAVNCNISLNEKENCFYQDVQFYGVNFPSDGPVMTRATEGWEPSAETMYGRDGVLKGDVTKALKVGKKHYMCEFKSTYKANDPSVKPPPGFHFIDHRIEIMKHDKEYNTVDLLEVAIARNSSVPPLK